MEAILQLTIVGTVEIHSEFGQGHSEVSAEIFKHCMQIHVHQSPSFAF
jgi:hypothetical protein